MRDKNNFIFLLLYCGIFDDIFYSILRWYTCQSTELACRNQAKGIPITIRIRFRTTTLHWLVNRTNLRSMTLIKLTLFRYAWVESLSLIKPRLTSISIIYLSKVKNIFLKKPNKKLANFPLSYKSLYLTRHLVWLVYICLVNNDLVPLVGKYQLTVDIYFTNIPSLRNNCS